MDGRGRATGLRLAFAVGVLGALVTFTGARQERTELFLAGLALLGVCCGGVNLARAGAADMYPPETRARGVSYVLVGAAAGAIRSPLVYAPLLSGARSGGNAPRRSRDRNPPNPRRPDTPAGSDRKCGGYAARPERLSDPPPDQRSAS